MALAPAEEREKAQRGASYRARKHKKPNAGVLPDRKAGGSVPDVAAKNERFSVDVVGTSLAADDNQPSQLLGNSDSVDSARDDGTTSSLDIPSTLDPSLQQGMMEYVADLRELLEASLITQDEFTQWVLRKADGLVLEEHLRKSAVEEGKK